MRFYFVCGLLLFCIAAKAQSLQTFLEDIQLHLKDNEYEKAVDKCDIVLKGFPDNTNVILLKSQALRLLDKKAAACSCVIDAIILKSKTAENQYIEHCKNYAPSLDIAKFKTGTFVYPASENKIIRSDSIHKEYLANNLFIKSSIEWDATNYTVTVLSTNRKDNPIIKTGDVMKCRIIYTRRNRYLYIAYFKGDYFFDWIIKTK